MFLFVFGGTLFLPLVIWLIVCPPLSYTIRFLTPFSSLTNHFISFLVSLVVLALFIFSLLDRTSFPPKPWSASFWDIPDFRRVVVVIPLRLIDTLSPLMSPSLRTHHSFPPLLSLFLFLKSCPFPLSPHLMLCLLDHFRFIIVALVSLLLSLLLRHLLTHFLSLRLLLPRLCLLLMIYPLLFRKVLALLVIFILFTIFWVIIDYLHPILFLFLLYPLFLFQRAPWSSFPSRLATGNGGWNGCSAL